MAFYEHVVIARQDISPQQAETLNEELKALIEDQGGHIAKIEYWGLRNLTYRIKKNRKGHYSLLAIDAPARGGEGDGAPAVDQRRRAALPDRARRRARPRAVARAGAQGPRARTRRSHERVRSASTTSRPKEQAQMTERNRDQIPTPGGAAGCRRPPFFRRRKVCPFSGANAPKIDYKDVKLLQRYISERGKIVPSRITAVSAQEAARTGQGHQARPLPRAPALRREVGAWTDESHSARTRRAPRRPRRRGHGEGRVRPQLPAAARPRPCAPPRPT